MTPRSPAIRRAARALAVLLLGWLAATALLHGLHVGAHHQAYDGPPGAVAMAAYRVEELFAVPFSLLVRRVVRPHDYHYPPLYYLTRSTLTAGFYVGLVWIAWLALRARPRDGGDGDGAPDPPAPDRGERGGATRRDLLAGGALATAGLAGGGLAGWATVVEPSTLRVRRYTIPITDLPAALDGLRVAHLTDTHYGPFVRLPRIRRAIARANAERPDLTVLTGDYVHRTAGSVPAGVGVFEGLEARLGIAAVLGNHDHWEDADGCRSRFATLGIPLLDNRRLFLTADGLADSERAGESLAICGAGDPWEDVSDLTAAVAGVSPGCPRLLLCHNPDVAEFLPASHPGHRVDLQLSGHTHGGQVRVPGLGTPLVPSEFGARYAGGLVEGPAWRVLVSRGVGDTVLPVRFDVPPEISLITLTRA